MNVSEKAAYLKGLIEGMNYDKDSNEGKLFAGILDLLISRRSTRISVKSRRTSMSARTMNATATTAAIVATTTAARSSSAPPAARRYISIPKRSIIWIRSCALPAMPSLISSATTIAAMTTAIAAAGTENNSLSC